MTTPIPARTRRGVAAPRWLRSPVWLGRLALASVVVNVGIVVTGGAVRLSDSGLGCPSWPTCAGSSLVPTHQIGIHNIIEFGNRALTFAVGLTLLITLLAAWAQRRCAGLAALALAGIPAQAVLGGIVVLTHLNPYLVALHFLLSMAIIAVTLLLWWRVREERGVDIPVPARVLVRAVAGVALLVLLAGTVVTGSGPHAGDLDQDGQLHRIHLSPAAVSQMHADLVMVLIGLTAGALVLSHVLREPTLRRAATVLLAIELAQGVLGYTQYFLHVPPLLVGLHILGACLVWLAALRLLLLVETTVVVVTPAVP